MQIAVLSDIHDHVWNLAAALEHVRDCDQLICCGDLCSPFIIDQLGRGFAGPIHVVFGNNDADLFRITGKAPRYPQLRLRGEYFEDTFGACRIAVNHFDSIGLAIARGASGRFDAVFYGHNHVHRIERFGETLAVNPGSIMGAQFDAEARRTDVDPTFVIFSTQDRQVRSFRILPDRQVAPLSA